MMAQFITPSVKSYPRKGLPDHINGYVNLSTCHGISVSDEKFDGQDLFVITFNHTRTSMEWWYTTKKARDMAYDMINTLSNMVVV